MSQYARQRDESGCGPVALLNAMKWANPTENISYSKWYKPLCRMTQKTKDGVDSKVFRGVLTTLGDSANFKVVKMRKFDYDRIMNHLYKGGALILGHYEIPQEGVDDYEPHYSFWVDGDEEDSIHGINVLRKPAATVNSFSSVVLYGMESRTMEYLNEPMEIFLLTRKDLYV